MTNINTQYTEYILDHKENVRKAFDWLVSHEILKDNSLIAKVQVNVTNHDMSKYGPEEFDVYAAYFYGKRTSRVEREFNYAWLHHIHHNQHHWQHWLLVNDTDGTYALEMPEEYVYEMICDWWAFSFKKNNLYEIFDWFKTQKDMVLHEKTRKLVESIFDKIKKILDSENKS